MNNKNEIKKCIVNDYIISFSFVLNYFLASTNRLRNRDKKKKKKDYKTSQTNSSNDNNDHQSQQVRKFSLD
jgi:hypothetical protein